MAKPGKATKARNAAGAAGGAFFGAGTIAGVKRLRNRKGGLLTQAAQARGNAAKAAKRLVPRGRPGAKNR